MIDAKTENQIIELYVNQRMTQREVSKALNLSTVTVSQFLITNGLSRNNYEPVVDISHFFPKDKGIVMKAPRVTVGGKTYLDITDIYFSGIHNSNDIREVRK